MVAPGDREQNSLADATTTTIDDSRLLTKRALLAGTGHGYLVFNQL